MLNDHISRLMKAQQEKEIFSESLKTSNEYMEWIEKNTRLNNSVSTDSFQYQEGTTKKDIMNAKAIQFLFEEIREYCIDNYIEPKEREYGFYYSIKNNNIGYHVGYDGGQGAYFYCTRLEKPESDALDFKHVTSGKKLPETLYYEYILQDLSSIIQELQAAGVPEDAIRRTVETSMCVKDNQDTDKKQK